MDTDRNHDRYKDAFFCVDAEKSQNLFFWYLLNSLLLYYIEVWVSLKTRALLR